MHQKHNQTMERRMTGNCHVRCEAGENPEITSKDYLSLFGEIPNFNLELAVIRKYNIRVCIVLQAFSQLKSVYDEKIADGILSNCSTLTYLGTTDKDTTDYVSWKLGKTTARVDTKSFNRGNQGGGTDSAAFTQGGFRSVGITGLSHKLEDYYHTRRDSCDHLNRTGLENCYLATVRFIEKLAEE